MADTEILACRTIELELRKAMEETGLDYPVIWIPSGLHNVPKKLTAALNERLAEVSCKRLLMAMGFCGNAVAGLRTGGFQLILPRVDDCISLLLGLRERQLAGSEAPTYFLTKGWLDGERNIWTEYEYTIDKYGRELGQQIFDVMFGHYRQLGVLDTGCFSLADIREEIDKIARALKLECRVIPAGYRLLRQLLTGPWPDELFITVPEYSELGLRDLTLQAL